MIEIIGSVIAVALTALLGMVGWTMKTLSALKQWAADKDKECIYHWEWTKNNDKGIDNNKDWIRHRQGVLNGKEKR